MGVDERHRLALHEAARQTWGQEIAVTLMEMLPPGGWAEVATKSDLGILRADVDHLGIELRAEIARLGSELRTEMADLSVTVERSLRTSLMWTMTTMLAGLGGVAAVTAVVR